MDLLARVVDAALLEDLGPDFTDITTDALIGDEPGAAEIIANEAGVAAGLEAAAAVFRRLEPQIFWRRRAVDGGTFPPGASIARVEGRLRTILAGERTALNLLSHLSGIATLTARYAQAVAGTKARIFDTRKTLPNLRFLEKAAVLAGGGYNHRFGLYDGVLIKDNHLAGLNVAEAIRRAKTAYPDRRIEVEVEEIDQLHGALAAGADIVLLDNMDIDTLRAAIAVAKGRAEIEVSGGVTLETVGAVARAGAERISVGALTQGARPIDFSLAVTAGAGD